ncbi:MAG: single-stranded-DNA-specific exonuclease RecJ [Gammaproteobacteria bacterium]
MTSQVQPRIVRRSLPQPPVLPAGLHPVLSRVYAGRGVRSADDIDYSLAQLHPFQTLQGIAAAAALLARALEHQARILIVGDFDADGATASAVAVRGLCAMGAEQVGFLVPNRFEYGYGLSPEIVAVAAEQRPQLIVTVDNGISSVEGVAAAQRLGIEVLITDHHLPGATLPAATAIVNPNQAGDPFPSKHLAGVGVMFYVLMALRAELRERGWFRRRGMAEPRLAELLDLVALGTVADVVVLDRNNRILVSQGLARIRAGRCQPGVRALLDVAKRPLASLTARDLGYAAAPRLNAAGRLADMSLGIRCLLSDDYPRARALAEQLDRLNCERRVIESRMHDEALVQLERLGAPVDGGRFGLCLFDEGWHQGVIGLLAGRLRERLGRPVIAFANGLGDEVKGSARSVTGLHIRDALDAVAARHPGLLRKFGGHAMAAGLTLERRRVREFGQAFDAELERRFGGELPNAVLHSDGELNDAHMSLNTAETLQEGGPWGQGFSEPLFDGELEVLRKRLVGERHLKLSVRAQPGGPVVTAMGFNCPAHEAITTGARLHLAFRIEVDSYQGQRSPRLTIAHIVPPAT